MAITPSKRIDEFEVDNAPTGDNYLLIQNPQTLQYKHATIDATLSTSLSTKVDTSYLVNTSKDANGRFTIALADGTDFVVGEEVREWVKNVDTVSIPNAVAYVHSGNVGSSNVPQVKRYAGESYVSGIITVSDGLPVNGMGSGVYKGMLTMNTSAWSAGTRLYVQSNGTLGTTATDWYAARVVNQHTTQGLVYVNLRVDSYGKPTMNSLLSAKEPIITPGTTAQFYRGDKTWQSFQNMYVQSLDNQSGFYIAPDSRSIAFSDPTGAYKDSAIRQYQNQMLIYYDSAAHKYHTLDSNTGNLILNGASSLGIGTSPSARLHMKVGNVQGLRVESSNSGYIELSKTNATRWAFRNEYTSGGLLELSRGASGASPTTIVASWDTSNNFRNIGSISSPASTGHYFGRTTAYGSATLGATLSAGEGDPPTLGGTIAAFQCNGGAGYSGYVAIIAGTTGNAELQFGDKDAQDAGVLRYSNANNRFSFTQPVVIGVGGVTPYLYLGDSYGIRGESGHLEILGLSGGKQIRFLAPGGTVKTTIDGDTGSITFADAGNIATGTTTGTKIGTATTQKLGFWNATPVVQPTTSVAAATFVAGTGTAVNDASTFDGYTLKQVVKALRNTGLLA